MAPQKAEPGRSRRNIGVDATLKVGTLHLNRHTSGCSDSQPALSIMVSPRDASA